MSWDSSLQCAKITRQRGVNCHIKHRDHLCINPPKNEDICLICDKQEDYTSLTTFQNIFFLKFRNYETYRKIMFFNMMQVNNSCEIKWLYQLVELFIPYTPYSDHTHRSKIINTMNLSEKAFKWLTFHFLICNFNLVLESYFWQFFSYFKKKELIFKIIKISLFCEIAK